MKKVKASIVIGMFLFGFNLVHAETELRNYNIRNIEMKYPAGWTRWDHPGLVAAFLSARENAGDVFQENVNLIVQDLSAQPMTLADYTLLATNQVAKLILESKMLESADFTWNGLPAHFLVYEGRQAQLKLKFYQAYTIKDNKAYLMTYTAEPESYDKFLNDAKLIIDSVKIK